MKLTELHTEQAHVVYAGNGVPVIKFKAFESMDWFLHGFSTREGGVSEGIYTSMNLSFTRGDDEAAVTENFRRFGQAVDMDYKAMVFTHQTHTTNIRVVTGADKGKGIVRERDFSDVDGFITNTPGVPLVTFFADCVPLFFADPQHQAIGASHSGWRGTVARMGRKTVQAMADTFGSKPEQLVAVIGPSVCQSCYEVSEDVADAFMKEFDPGQWPDILTPTGKDKYLLNLWKANQYILQEAGIPEENIHISGLCTHCHPDLLWSHRKLGKARGSLAGFMMIK